MKQIFTVQVQRASARTYQILAESEKEAEEIALDRAYNEDWACEDAEYMIY